MALTDILANSGNVSAIIEVITLFFIVAGFFRWYDGKYQKGMTNVKNEVIEHMDGMHATLIERIERMDRAIMRLEDRFHNHVTDEEHGNHNRKRRIHNDEES